MLSFIEDIRYNYPTSDTRLASVLMITIDDIVVFGAMIYNEYIDIFNNCSSIVDISENKDYTKLNFLNESGSSMLQFTVPPKLGAVFLSNPGFHITHAQTEVNMPCKSTKFDRVSLGWKYFKGDFIPFQDGGPMDLLDDSLYN